MFRMLTVVIIALRIRDARVLSAPVASRHNNRNGAVGNLKLHRLILSQAETIHGVVAGIAGHMSMCILKDATHGAGTTMLIYLFTGKILFKLECTHRVLVQTF